MDVEEQDLWHTHKVQIRNPRNAINCRSLPDTEAQVMFDKGLEITLVSRFFAKRNNLPFEESTYTLAGVGSKATTYNSGENGRIYTVPLMDSNGEIVLVKAFLVENILTDKIGIEEVKFNPRDFPRLSKETLQEAGKPLPRKNLIY